MEKKFLKDKILYETPKGEFLGHLIYREEAGVYYAVSTVVDKQARGQGIAKKLVLDFIALAEQNNKKIIPVCSYVVDFFEKNEEYQQLLQEK